MHHDHNAEQIFETLKIHSPNATILRLPKNDTLVVEAGHAVITIDGKGSVHLASRSDISVTTEMNISIKSPQKNVNTASSLCNRTALQYDALTMPESALTGQGCLSETSSTGDDKDTISS